MDTFRTAFLAELKAIYGEDNVAAPQVACGGDTTCITCGAGSTDDGAEPYIVRGPRELAGLTLSGGGIRSATFNLGLLQGLAERDLLGIFDYLSTVSGGGYIGSFWSAWRKRNPNGDLFPINHSSPAVDTPVGTPAGPNEKPIAPDRPENIRSEPDPIRHLREFSRFLAPRWGLFEIETWQFFGGALSAVLPAVVVGFSVIAILIWYVLVISANGMGGNQLISIWNHPLPSISYLYMALAVVVVSTLMVMWLYERGTQAHERQEGENYFGWIYWCSVFLSAAIAGGTEYLILRKIHNWAFFEIMPGLNQTFAERARFLAPAIGWSAAMLVLIFLRVFASRFIFVPLKGFYRAAVDRVIARLLGLAVFWTVMILFVFAAFILWTRNPIVGGLWTAAVGGGSGGVFGVIQKFLSRQPSRAKGGLFAYAERYALPLLAMIAVFAAGLGVASLILTCIDRGHALAGVLTPLGICLAALFFYNPNEVGMHPLYRSRLSRTYLGASNAKARRAAKNRQSIERPGDDLLMRDLLETKPVHLICCAANDLSGDHLANLSRGARSATLSPFGFTLANRFQSWKDAPAGITLATAMTASAAAFNSNMGSLSMDVGAAATFLMASLNLRLGYWYHLTKLRRLAPGWDFFLEMFSFTKSGRGSNSIHLSDGGHFENLALYELLRRRCRYILVSDCGADSEATFDDVGNALRRAREDFGVEVEIDLSALRPDEKRFSRQHVASGDIVYPGGDRGILLLFKPTLVGDEPGDVLQYKTHNQSFPHESTGEQFYDEKQWESYRRLGLHAARMAFRFLDDRDDETRVASAVFEEARTEWLPTPPTLPDQLMARAAELQAIERQVMTLGSVSLLRDLYSELSWGSDAKHSNDVTVEELAKLVPLFAQVLQLMTDVYVSCNLERSWSHPLNIGWVNWFGRWSTTPAFRDLWPFLSPMFNPKMRNFFEDRFELQSGAQSWSNGTVIELPKDDAAPGLALEIWRAMHPGKNRDGFDTLSYRVTTREGREVDVAILFYTKEDGRKTWTDKWTDPDFFVPPSFWQAGIGSAFLEKIGPAVVRIIDDRWRRKEVSETVQLYSQAGFKIIPSGGGVIEMQRD